MTRLEIVDGYDQFGEERVYTDPDAWRAGDRCPFCLASDGPVASERFVACYACGARAVFEGDPEYESLGEGKFFES